MLTVESKIVSIEVSDPHSYSVCIHTQRPILHRLVTVHFCPKQTYIQADRHCARNASQLVGLSEMLEIRAILLHNFIFAVTQIWEI